MNMTQSQDNDQVQEGVVSSYSGFSEPEKTGIKFLGNVKEPGFIYGTIIDVSEDDKTLVALIDNISALGNMTLTLGNEEITDAKVLWVKEMGLHLYYVCIKCGTNTNFTRLKIA